MHFQSNNNNAIMLEEFLAKLYTDEQILRDFLSCPEDLLRPLALHEEQQQALFHIDRAGLILAHESYKRKREKHVCQKKRSVLSRFFLALANLSRRY